MHTIDTLIIGGGIAGASLACSLAERGAGPGVAIADVDVFGKYNSSELNGGGVRATFAEPINVRISLKSIRYYIEHARQFDFRQRGYLWMYDEELWEQAREFLPTVRSFGLPVEELTAAELKKKFDVLDDVSDLAGATFTPFDGRLSPHRLRMHYLNHAQAGGVELVDRWEVIGIDGEKSPYEVRLRRVAARGVLKTLVGTAKPQAESMTISARRVVNAAGPWSGKVARMYGRELPVTPLPRQVYLLAHASVDLEPLPFFLDYPQDIYFRHYERDGRPCTLVSWSDPAEREGISFEHHGDKYYQQHVAPRLNKRIAAMKDAQLIGGWVGHYELTPDKGAIVGAVPAREGIFNYNGLSAHGVMQSRALGDAMAELLTKGTWPTDLNLDALREDRFGPDNLVVEKMYV